MSQARPYELKIDPETVNFQCMDRMESWALQISEQEWNVKLLDAAEELRRLRAAANHRTGLLTPGDFGAGVRRRFEVWRPLARGLMSPSLQTSPGPRPGR